MYFATTRAVRKYAYTYVTYSLTVDSLQSKEDVEKNFEFADEALAWTPKFLLARGEILRRNPIEECGHIH